jgi:hypothetical protein
MMIKVSEAPIIPAFNDRKKDYSRQSHLNNDNEKPLILYRDAPHRRKKVFNVDDDYGDENDKINEKKILYEVMLTPFK